MLLSESFSRIQSPARYHVKDKLACAVTPTCTHFPAFVRQSMRNGVTASSFKSNTCDCSVCGSRATNFACPAQISTVRVKRQSARSRTANITARADRQGMNSNADYAQKPDKQVSLARASTTVRRAQTTHRQSQALLVTAADSDSPHGVNVDARCLYSCAHRRWAVTCNNKTPRVHAAVCAEPGEATV